MTELTDHIRRYMSLSSLIDMLVRCELALLDPRSWDDRNDSYFMARYKEGKGIQSLYGMCAARCSETYHHWRVFTEGREGVCVELKRALLESTLSSDPRIRFGNVEYLLLDQVSGLRPSDIDRLPFCKRAGFEPESEYRIVAASPEPQASVLGIPLQLGWISKVYLNPWMPASVAHSVRSTIRGLPGCSKLRVVRSHLIDNERWKGAGDRVAGKATTAAHKTAVLKKPSTATIKKVKLKR